MRAAFQGPIAESLENVLSVPVRFVPVRLSGLPLGNVPSVPVRPRVLRRSPTPPARTHPDCGYSPSRIGLIAQAHWRSPGSRACCFSACLGSSTTPGPFPARELAPDNGVAFPLTEKGRHPVLSFRSSIAQPTGASVYASPAASRRHAQDSRSGWSRFSFPVGLFHPPTTRRFIPTLSGCAVTHSLSAS